MLHLLYARFWHKVLYDLGHVAREEPFRRLFNQGYIQAYAYTDARGVYVPAEEVVEDRPGRCVHVERRSPSRREYGKMGKSLNNVVTPDEMCERYGADTFRLYEMSTGPDGHVPAVVDPGRRRLAAVPAAAVAQPGRRAAPASRGSSRRRAGRRRPCGCCTAPSTGCTTDYAALHYNTAIAKLIELNNHLTKLRAGAGVRGRWPSRWC